ncbi:hypothetical protein AVEN_69476-1 [Araneus ventricosus]|uniref:GED domain-containing protein n=1 Tax=Araneus ventricosus TaxID=182803 RepID=A0A4Y2I9X8_ARAVE|nr:hypothetical protein AVEN_69476-1 [Araneus ventricosus]
MQRLVNQFIDDINRSLFGNSGNVCLESLKAGAIINYKMHVEIQEILKLPANLTEEELMNIIANVHGTRDILSIPSVTLEAACGSILEKYRESLEGFVDSISSILISAVENSCSIVLDYPALKEDLVHFINEFIDSASEETKDLLEKHLDAEMKYCNIYHCDFSKSKWEGGLACSPVIVWNSDVDGNDNEDYVEAINSHTDDLDSYSELISGKMKRNNNMRTNAKNLLGIVTEYIRLVQKQISDTTLKYINCFLVHQVFDFIKTALMIKLLNSPNKNSILEECEQEFQRRNELLDLCADLEEALLAVQAF